MSSSCGVEIIGRCMVKPARQLADSREDIMEMSPIDIFWSDYGYAKSLHFFSSAQDNEIAVTARQDSHRSQHFGTLKRSLAEVLAFYYPAAGRLGLMMSKPSNNGPIGTANDDRRGMVINCNDAGVEFVEAISRHVTYSSLQHHHNFATQDFFTALARSTPRSSSEDPIMSIQVTCFPDGGFSIGCCCDHSVFDGFSFWGFMSAWGECHRALHAAAGELSSNGTTLSSPPIHMRSSLKGMTVGPRASMNEMPSDSNNTRATIDRHNTSHEVLSMDWQLPVILPFIASEPKGYNFYSSHFQGDEDELKAMANGNIASNEKIQKIPPVEVRTLHITMEMVNEIKNAAHKASHTKFTSFVCLAAYIWKRRVMANLQLSGKERVGLRFPANIRPRMVPPLPQMYFGPAIIHVAVVPAPTAQELRMENLTATAKRIHTSLKKSCVDSFIREQLTHYASGSINKIEAFAAYNDDNGSVLVTEISDNRYANLYNVDFGWQGYCLDAVRPVTHRGAGIVTFSPGHLDHTTIDAFINLRQPELDQFCTFDQTIT